jgi:hypothetical protein
MAKTVFSKAAYVEVEGIDALRLMERRAEVTTYGVRGLDNSVIVQDFRPRTRTPLNNPAHVTIRNQPNDCTLVQLRPTTVRDPRHTLWIASGIDEFLPQYDCLYDRFDFLDDNTFAFLALFKRPRRAQLNEDFSFLTV